MKKSELKQILKPLIKECIKEVVFEEGILSNIVAEVAQGLGGQKIVETKQPDPPQRDYEQENRVAQQKLQETRERMLDAIGSDAYNGVDVFAGTTPTRAPSESKQGDPLGGVDPGDPGVDISRLFGGANRNWAGTVK
jgi:hypothetical protein|tara:strand:+ start:2700 stop:3110 length:411 start_codon:yes stop_codon:yes gene_type:complete